MTTIIFVRHGQSKANVLDRLNSNPKYKYGLTELGKKQAESAAKEIRKINVSRIVASPLERAKQTAEILNAGLGLNIEVDDRIIEIKMGGMEGKSCKEGRWYFELGERKLKKLKVESWAHLEHRVNDFMDSLSDYKGAVVAVSHEDTIRAAISSILGLGRYELLGMAIKNGSLTAISHSEEGYKLWGASMPCIPKNMLAKIKMP
ncbi:histidine phosphatase family protein [Candidatus Marsarchaeota archaeon]|jgi:probable phosphoglycerate mutase|nr:histidine phosphatase family protein [Candidatus Marsarchaeota archaeon]